MKYINKNGTHSPALRKFSFTFLDALKQAFNQEEMDEINKEFLRKYIAGKCNQSELLKIRSFLQNPEFQNLIEEVLAEEGNPIKAEYDLVDPQMEGWTSKINEKLHQQNFPSQEIKGNRNKLKFFKYAAIWFAMLFTVGILVFLWREQQKQEVLMEYTETYNNSNNFLQIQFSDSSVVTLAPRSTLRYPKTFAAENRIVQLQGEAFFDISKDPNRPFLVRSGEMETKVLGTSFKISAYKNAVYKVSVSTGKVRVSQQKSTEEKNLATLTPGKEMAYQNGKTTIQDFPIEQNTQWLEGTLRFRDTELQEVCQMLAQWKGVKIIFKDLQLQHRKVSIQLNAKQSLIDNLKLLSATAGINYTKNNNEILLYDR